MEIKKGKVALNDELLEMISGGSSQAQPRIVMLSELKTQEINYYLLGTCPNKSCRKPLKASNGGGLCESCNILYVV